MSPTVSIRPKSLHRLAKLTVGVAALGLLVVLATTRAAQSEPDDGSSVALAAAMPQADRPDGEPTWNLAAEPVERIGYRHGRQHVFDVVPLGPNAIEVEVRTARAFLAMRAAAAEAGVELYLESGFRTVEQQRALFLAWRSGQGNMAARPGRSNHQSGRALDIATSIPGALAWLEANAATFGFKRTVKTEPWHWEYVDMPIARGATKRASKKKTKAKVVGHARRPVTVVKKAPRSSRGTSSRL